MTNSKMELQGIYLILEDEKEVYNPESIYAMGQKYTKTENYLVLK